MVIKMLKELRGRMGKKTDVKYRQVCMYASVNVYLSYTCLLKTPGNKD